MNHPIGEQLLGLLRKVAELPPEAVDKSTLGLLVGYAADEIEFYLDAQDVQRFAGLMVAKLARSARDKGRHGWRERTAADLLTMLRERIEKGDMVDVANFAMMVHYLSEASDNWAGRVKAPDA